MGRRRCALGTRRPCARRSREPDRTRSRPATAPPAPAPRTRLPAGPDRSAARGPVTHAEPAPGPTLSAGDRMGSAALPGRAAMGVLAAALFSAESGVGQPCQPRTWPRTDHPVRARRGRPGQRSACQTATGPTDIGDSITLCVHSQAPVRGFVGTPSVRHAAPNRDVARSELSPKPNPASGCAAQTYLIAADPDVWLVAPDAWVCTHFGLFLDARVVVGARPRLQPGVLVN
jgi:hypothetical protein